MFGKLFGGKKGGGAKPPSLAPKSLNEAIDAALDYGAYSMFDNAGEIFIPSILQFGDMGMKDAKTDVRRFLDQSEDGMIDIGAGVEAALKAFETPGDGMWEVVIFEAVQTLQSGEKLDCFTGYARDNITGQDFRFSRSFADRGDGREWVEDVMIAPFDPA